jgi:hypothetical protein
VTTSVVRRVSEDWEGRLGKVEEEEEEEERKCLGRWVLLEISICLRWRDGPLF